MSTTTEQALRAMSDDGDFRILLARTTETARSILEAQRPSAELRGLLVDLVTASVLLRLTMSPDNRLQVILQNERAGSLVADSHPDGTTRGLVQSVGDIPLSTGPETHLSVHRTMFSGEIHQGVVQTSSEQSLGDAVSGYLHRSEQITSVVELGHSFDGDHLEFAGGYVVQIVPADSAVDHTNLALMTARLQKLASLPKLFESVDFDDQGVVDELFGPLDYQILGQDEFRAGCICSPDRVLQALATLSEKDRAELKGDGQTLEVDCEYCKTTHRIAAEDI